MTPSLLLLLRRPGPVISVLVHGAVVATAFLAVTPTGPEPVSSFAGSASFDTVPLDVAAASLAAPEAPDVEPPESVEPRTAEEVVVEDVPEPAVAPDDAVIRVAADVAARPLPVPRRNAPAGPAGPVGPAVAPPAGNGHAAVSLAGGPTGDAKAWMSNRKPVYPEAERLRGVEGVAVLRFVVHPDGSVEVSLVRSSGSDALDRAALDAVRSWRFSPALVDGVPTTDTFVQKFTFFLR